MNHTLRSLGAIPGGMGEEEKRDPSQEEGTADEASTLPDAPDPPSGSNGGS